MKAKVIIIVLCLLEAVLANGQFDVKKNLIQIGRSGYDFGDYPLRFGKSEIGIASGFYVYIPYLSYSRRLFNHVGLRVSFEEFDVSYCKHCTRPEPMKVTNRSFLMLQFGPVGYIPLSDHFELILNLSIARRFKGTDSGIESYIDKGWWEEAIAFVHKTNAWGGVGGIETKFKFFKIFSLSLKGEYILFNIDPKFQVGINGNIGYEF